MRIVLSNDDGVHAPGIAALAEALNGVAELLVVAPERERSAQSHALTLHKPLRAHQVGPFHWSVSGTPADCVYLALQHLCQGEPPVAVISGINDGANLGNDIFYSGTVAAAREGALQGVPALAVSMLRRTGAQGSPNWATAGAMARRVVERLIATPPAPDTLWNLNVPDLPLESLQGLKATSLGRRYYAQRVEARSDPRGGTYFWIGGAPVGFGDDPDDDGLAVDQGWASLSVLGTRSVSPAWIGGLRTFTDQ